VPPELVVAGNPARVLKSVSQVTCPLDLELGEYMRDTQTAPTDGAATKLEA
jgi:hypothetical protein